MRVAGVGCHPQAKFGGAPKPVLPPPERPADHVPSQQGENRDRHYFLLEGEILQ